MAILSIFCTLPLGHRISRESTLAASPRPIVTGSSDCDAARSYRRTLRERQENEATNLARLTGWSVNDVRRKMNLVSNDNPSADKKWWQSIWQ